MRIHASLSHALGLLAVTVATLLLAGAWLMLALMASFGVVEESTWSPYPAWIALGPFLLAQRVLPFTAALVAGALVVMASSLGLVLLVRALVRRRGAARTKLSARAGLALLAVAALVWGSHAWVLRVHRLAHVPRGLEVTRILYVREQAWGFGPGGNEVGVIVYQLPPPVAAKVREGGVAFLEGLRGQQPLAPGAWRGHYEGWAETPMGAGQRWTPRDCAPAADPGCDVPRLRHYLGPWGDAMGVDPDVERAVDDAVTRPGSYHGRARIGTLLIVPDQGRVYYLYEG